MTDSLSFESAIAEVNNSGWYLCQLGQNLHEVDPPTAPRWSCCLRSFAPIDPARPGRHEISHGHGDSAILAIYDALGSAPELEAEVSCVDLREIDARPTVDLMKLIVKREPINRRL